VLWYFTTWAQSLIELGALYRDKEGPAPVPDRRNPEGRHTLSTHRHIDICV
jgi:hypothetical protein